MAAMSSTRGRTRLTRIGNFLTMLINGWLALVLGIILSSRKALSEISHLFLSSRLQNAGDRVQPRWILEDRRATVNKAYTYPQGNRIFNQSGNIQIEIGIGIEALPFEFDAQRRRLRRVYRFRQA